MQQLSAEEQSLLELRFVQELPLQSIGEPLGKGSEAIRLWLYRVRQRLANCVRRKLALGGAS